VRTRRVAGSCDHSQIYLGTKSIGGGIAIFDSISADLQTAIPSTPARPLLWEVSPNVLTTLPQRIRLFGSGFNASCTVTFNDGVTAPFTGVPIFVSGSELDYDIALGTRATNWTVKVVKGAQESDLRTFKVMPPIPTATGALTISLFPSEAILSGATWQADGGAFLNTGDVVTGLTPGTHAIAFHSASGFITPAGHNVNVFGGALTSETQTYSDALPSSFNLLLVSDGHGYISPSHIGTGTGNTYPDGGTLRLTAVAASGYHFIGWGGALSGSVNPADITMTGNKSVTANFAAGDPTLGTLTVTIQPPEAATAGVAWGWNDNDFRASGSSYTTYPGGYYIVVHYTNGWFGPGLVPVSLTAGQTTNYSVSVSTTNGAIVGIDPTTYYTLAGVAGVSGSADGTGIEARFNHPGNLALDNAGNVFVADSWNETIRKVSTNGEVTTIAGQAGVNAYLDGKGTNALFNNPTGIAVDLTGNIYVADFNNSVIRKITPDGMVSTFAGSAGNNDSVNATGVSARFYFPAGVAVDAGGNVLVADSVNQTIRRITPDRAVTTLAGFPRSFGSIDDVGDRARFHNPFAVAVDASGMIFVADEVNETVRKITPSGAVTTLAGFAGSGGASDGTGSAARFLFLSGIAVDKNGVIYVADTGNHAIRNVSQAGVVETLAGSSGHPGSSDGTGALVRFNNPAGIAVDAAGNVYVADSLNHTIRTTRPPSPKFSITSVAEKVTFSWPSTITGFILESSQSLASPAWETVFPPPNVVGAENRVTITVFGPTRFYRRRLYSQKQANRHSSHPSEPPSIWPAIIFAALVFYDTYKIWKAGQARLVSGRLLTAVTITALTLFCLFMYRP
jgi:sugar lactone lactonase YvrE